MWLPHYVTSYQRVASMKAVLTACVTAAGRCARSHVAQWSGQGDTNVPGTEPVTARPPVSVSLHDSLGHSRPASDFSYGNSWWVNSIRYVPTGECETASIVDDARVGRQYSKTRCNATSSCHHVWEDRHPHHQRPPLRLTWIMRARLVGTTSRPLFLFFV